MALLYWDPDGISGNNVLSTGVGLGGAGTWQNGGSSNWFNPLLNSGLGGYVSWNSSLGDTAVFAGLNGSNITITGDVSAAGLDFRGANVSISGGNLQTVAGGTNLVASVATRFDSSISGSGGIKKTGSGSVTLGAALSTYTGDTLISGGLLDVRGTVQSHIRVNGGSVQGVMFYDPDLAASVREGLGVDSSAWLTSSLLSQAAPLTRLTADANRVDDITGISNLSSLTEFSLIPTDYSVSSPSIASLAPLAGLTSLTSLRLQDTGLTNTSLATLPLLPNLRSLDVRYNALSVVPSAIANLPRLASLQIHGNPLLSDNPRSGLAALKGKLIDVDVAPDRPEIASDIPDLAARLYHLPLKMLEYVTNTIEFQPYSGAMKGPLATLQTKAGNSWDTNSLLAGLYAAAGISTRYVAGAVEVSESQLKDFVGTRDTLAAAKVLGAAGLQYDQFANRFKHTWLEALLVQPSSGSQSWLSVDGSWKLKDYRPGLAGILSSVPFSPLETDYLTNPVWQKKSTAEYYEAKVGNWLAQNRPDLTTADVAYDGPILQQSFKSLPALPYAVVNQPLVADRPGGIPTSANYTVNIKLANGSTALFGAGGVNLTLADVALSRLTIDPQFSATGTALPVLRRNGVVIASAPAAIANAANTSLALTFTVTAPAGGLSYSRSFTRAANRYIAIGLDANQFSEALLAVKRDSVNVQQLNQANGSPVDRDAAVGGLLDLAIAQYFTAANADEDSLAGLTSAVADRTIVALGIATSAPSLSNTATAGLQFPYLPLDMGLDVPANVNGSFAIDASNTGIDLNRNLLLGYTNSALEGLILEELTNFESVSTMKAFQRAATAARGLSNLVEINASNVAKIATLLPGVRADIRNAIANTVRNGLSGVADYTGVAFKALVPKKEISVGSGKDKTKHWKGVGYTLTGVTSDPSKAHLNGKTVGYIIHGAVGSNPLVSYGGATSRFILPPPIAWPSLLSSTESHGQGDPVNVANGNVYHEESDIEFPNLGAAFAFQRRFDSINTVSGLAGAGSVWSDRGMGEGWSYAYADRLEFNTDGANTITWFTGEGLRLVFTKSGKTYANPPGLYGVLSGKAKTGFTWQDFDGNKTTFSVSVGGFSQILTKQDRFSNGVSITYVAGTNRISRVADLRDANRFLSFTYNADSRPHIASITDFTGRTWSYVYSSDGRLSSVTKPVPAPGNAAPTIRYTYHGDNARRGLLASVIDPSGFTTSWEYFANRRGFRVIDAEGLRHSFSYDLYRRRSAFINEAGDVSRFSYDEQGNLLETLQADRTAERSTWSASGLKLSDKDAYGATTQYAYNARTGKVTSITDPLGNITRLAYTTGGFRDLSRITRLYRPKDASDDIVTAFTYDTTGFLTSRVEDSGTGRLNLTTRYTPAVGGRGLVQTTTSPRGIVTSYTYNPAGQQLTQSTPLGTSTTATVSSSYDNRGNRLSQTDANGNQTIYSYDALGRLLRTDSPPYGDVSIVGPLPTMHSTNAYDISGNLLTTTLNDGRVTRTGYDRRQRQVRVTAADGSYTLMSYDATGNKVSETDSLGRIKRFLYDARNRLVATVHPDGSTERIRVDGGGRVVANVDQAGATSLTSYDKLGRKVREALPDPDGAGPLSAPVSAWGYDSRGNLEFETRFFVGQGGVLAGDPNRSSQFSYDALGRKIREIQPDPDGSGPLTRPVTSWTYDADGNLLSLTDPRGSITSYTVDALGRKTSETTPDPDGSGALLPLKTGFVYDRAGNLRYTVAPGGTNESDVAFTTEYIYDQLNRLVRAVSPDPDGISGPLSRPTETRSYNASGFLASSTDALGRTTSFAYDRLGRVLAETNALGGVTRSTYDATGNRVSATDALGRRTFTTYDAMNRVLEVRAPRASSTAATPVSTFVYNATGNLISSTDALGRRRWQQFDALGRLTSQTNALGAFAGDPGATIRNEYDAAGRLLATTDELGRRTEMVYDNLGRRIRLLAPDAGLGRPTTYYGYDAAGNLRFSTDPRGASAGDPNFTTWLFYDALGRATATVDALGPDWAPTAIPDLLPSTVTTNVTRNVYDNRGRVAASINALGRQTDYNYDNLGRKISETAPEPIAGSSRSVTRTAYDAMGNTVSVTNPLGLVTSYTYDALNRRTRVTDARGLATITTFDAVGNTASITDASGNVTRYSYDRNNRLITEADPLGNLTAYAYDLVGNKIRETDRLNRITSYSFDVADRLVEERWQTAQSAPISHTIQRIYDSASQLLGVVETDSSNAAATTAWQLTYDANGNVVKSRMAPGEIVQNHAFNGAPNPPGSLTTSDATIDWDSDGVAERYDGYTINLAVGDQLLLTASSSGFDPVLMVQKPGGSFLFDDHSGGGTTARMLVTADVAGAWIFAVTAKEEQALGNYDLKIVQDKNVIVPTALLEYDFTYDKAGNRLSASEDQAAVADMYGFGKAASGLGVTTSYTLDGLNRVTRYQQVDSVTGAVLKRTDYAYRADTSVGSVTRFAGAGINPIGSSSATYDGMGRITGITHAPSASPSIAYGYAYDAASRMTSMTTPEGTSSFSLDATNQLLIATLTSEAYAYDNTGNRTSGGTQSGTGNRLLFDGTYRYAYDAEGNRTAKYLDTNVGGVLSVGDTDVTLYGYDQRNRLVAVSHVNTWSTSHASAVAAFAATGAGLPGSDLELRYSYDYADRRIRRSIDADGIAGAGQENVSFAGYAGDERTLEISRPNDKLIIDGTSKVIGFLGQVVQRNFYGNGLDEILAVDQISWNGTTPSSSTFWTFTDHQDSVRDIVSGTGANRGQVVEHRHYDSFGKIVRRTTGPQPTAPATAGVGINFGYAGRPLEARTGLSDNRARWYEPGSGKFINEDPSGFMGEDVNLFRYVGNDPLNQVDPSGLIAKWATYGGGKPVNNHSMAATSSSNLRWTHLAQSSSSRGPSFLSAIGPSLSSRGPSYSSGFGFRDALSLGVGFIPVVGSVQSLVEVVTGRDYISGQPVNRWHSAIGIVAGIIPGGKPATRIGSAAFGGISQTTSVVANVSRREVFRGIEVRAVRDLHHASAIHLIKMASVGVNPYNRAGLRLDYHHLNQRPEVVVMIPQRFHAGVNRNLHPNGNARGSGLGQQARTDYNPWRRSYNKEIARRELLRRAAGGATTQIIFPNYQIAYP